VKTNVKLSLINGHRLTWKQKFEELRAE